MKIKSEKVVHHDINKSCTIFAQCEIILLCFQFLLSDRTKINRNPQINICDDILFNFFFTFFFFSFHIHSFANCIFPQSNSTLCNSLFPNVIFLFFTQFYRPLLHSHTLFVSFIPLSSFLSSLFVVLSVKSVTSLTYKRHFHWPDSTQKKEWFIFKIASIEKRQNNRKTSSSCSNCRFQSWIFPSDFTRLLNSRQLSSSQKILDLCIAHTAKSDKKEMTKSQRRM